MYLIGQITQSVRFTLLSFVMDNTVLQSQDQGGSTVQSDQGNQAQEDQGNSQSSYTVGGRTYKSMQELGQDYEKLQTKFTQVSQAAKQPQAQSDVSENELDQIADMLAPRLTQKGFVSQDEMKLQTLMSLNPDLKSREQELRDLSALPHNKSKAYEDIVAQYNLVPSDKLVRAKTSGEVRGEPIPKTQPQQKAVKDMDLPEYEKWRESQGLNVRGASFLKRA